MTLDGASVDRQDSLVYPPTAAGTVGDVMHGIRVADPYRWLESADEPAVEKWATDQDAVTSAYLTRQAAYGAVVNRLTELWDFETVSLPVRVGTRLFVVRHEPGAEQPVLFLVSDEPGSPEIELINPNQSAADGMVALTGWWPSSDANLIAYAIAERGEDWQEIRVREVESGRDLPDVLRWTKSEEDIPFPDVAWHPDGNGFYYTRLPASDEATPQGCYRNSGVYWHLIGTSQDDDRLIFENPEDPDESFVPIIADGGRHLLLHAWRGLSHIHQIIVLPLDGEGESTRLFAGMDARFLYVGSIGESLIFLTNEGAPNGRLIGIDINSDRRQWEEIVPEQNDRMAHAVLVGEAVFVVTVRGSHHIATIFNRQGVAIHSIALPGIGTVSDIGHDPITDVVLIAFESFLQPPLTLRYDLATGDLSSWRETILPFDFRPYEVTQDVFLAGDGASIPITLVHRSGIALDRSHPTLLYGYGGFDLSITPSFNPSLLLWLESGGIYAVANIRGGGEFGESWHAAGKGRDKQRVFDDFATAGDWLIERGYTSSDRLSATGESNGGLLVAATMLQRPELFAAVICSIPVTDMLRFHQFTIGHYWTFEYGNPEDDAEAFRTLYAYSPIHNVQAGTDYPPILVTTGETDDRVVPAHAMKLVAALQGVASPDARPRLLRYQKNVGHGLGKPRSKVIELDCDIFTFLMAACRVTPC